MLLVLFFGCRRSDQDYIYQQELEQYASEGILTSFHTAFSRNEEQSPIKYVQHVLISNAPMVWDLIYPTDPEAKPATICVCGSGAMSRDIFCAFAYISISLVRLKLMKRPKTY